MDRGHLPADGARTGRYLALWRPRAHRRRPRGETAAFTPKRGSHRSHHSRLEPVARRRCADAVASLSQHTAVACEGHRREAVFASNACPVSTSGPERSAAGSPVIKALASQSCRRFVQVSGSYASRWSLTRVSFGRAFFVGHAVSL